MIDNRSLVLKNMKEAKEVLLGIISGNKTLLKKNPNFYEDYSLLLSNEKVILNYSIEDKSNITYGSGDSEKG